MKVKGKITLKGLTQQAYIGIYEEEQEKGNAISIDVHMEKEFLLEELADLDKTIDYEQVERVILHILTQPERLLETVAGNILQGVLGIYPRLTAMEITVKKLTPPLQSAIDYSAFTLNWEK